MSEEAAQRFQAMKDNAALSQQQWDEAMAAAKMTAATQQRPVPTHTSAFPQTGSQDILPMGGIAEDTAIGRGGASRFARKEEAVPTGESPLKTAMRNR